MKNVSILVQRKAGELILQFKFKLIIINKNKKFSFTRCIYSLNRYLWLLATKLNGTDIKYFYHCNMFYFTELL
jgi:hypothetical protein